MARCLEDLEHERIFIRHAKVRGHLKGTKTSAGSREVTLQPQAKEALLSQHTYTGKIREIVFHDSRTGEPRKNDQAIRKAAWAPALKCAGKISKPPTKPATLLPLRSCQEVKIHYGVPSKWATKTGGKLERVMGSGFRK